MSRDLGIELAPERLANAGSALDTAWSGDQYVVLTVNSTDFAVVLSAIQEVDRVPPIVPVPGSPGWVRGIANLRGTILSICDFGAMLGLDAWSPDGEARILVVRSREPVAIGVDGVRGMRQLSLSPLIGVDEALPDQLSRYITGVHRGDDGLIYAIDLMRLLDDADAMVSRSPTGKGTTLLPGA